MSPHMLKASTLLVAERVSTVSCLSLRNWSGDSFGSIQVLPWGFKTHKYSDIKKWNKGPNESSSAAYT